LWCICALLGNGSVNSFPKHTLTKIGHPLLGNGPINTHSWQQKTVFSLGSVLRPYKRAQLEEFEATRVEAGSNISTVTLRVVGGDEKGSLNSETVKYGHESQETRIRGLRWRGLAAYTKDRPVLLSESAPHKNKTVTVKSNKYLVMNPRWSSTPRLNNWLTVSNNVTLSLTLTWRRTEEYKGVRGVQQSSTEFSWKSE
jgi:hypothetical protein